MPDKPNRDDKGPSSGPHISLDIDGVDDAYRGGERLFGTVVVESTEDAQVEALEIAPALEFRRPEPREYFSHEHRDPRRPPIRREDLALEAGRPLEVDFDFKLPPGPYLVGAEHFSVDWTVSARADIDRDAHETIRESSVFEPQPRSTERYEPEERRDLSCQEEAPPPEQKWEHVARLVLLAVAVAVLGGVFVAFFMLAFGPASPSEWVATLLFFGAASLIVVMRGISESWVQKGLRRQLQSALWTTDKDALVGEIDVDSEVLAPGDRATFRTWLLASHPVQLERIEYTLTCRERHPDPNAPMRSEVVTETRFERTWVHRVRPIRELEAGEEFSHATEVELPEDASRTVASESAPGEWAVEWQLRADLRKSKYPPRTTSLLEKKFLVDHY